MYSEGGGEPNKNKHVREDRSSDLPLAVLYSVYVNLHKDMEMLNFSQLFFFKCLLLSVIILLSLAKMKCSKTSINIVLGMPVKQVGNKAF